VLYLYCRAKEEEEEINTLFLKGIDNNERYINYTGNKNCGFLFYFQILFEAFLKSY
jgi:hypothetical protein